MIVELSGGDDEASNIQSLELLVRTISGGAFEDVGKYAYLESTLKMLDSVGIGAETDVPLLVDSSGPTKYSVQVTANEINGNGHGPQSMECGVLPSGAKALVCTAAPPAAVPAPELAGP